MNRYIILNDDDDKVIGIRWGSSIVDGEIASDRGEIGQLKQANGTFIDDATTDDLTPTLEDKVNYLYYKSKGLI